MSSACVCWTARKIMMLTSSTPSPEGSVCTTETLLCAQVSQNPVCAAESILRVQVSRRPAGVKSRLLCSNVLLVLGFESLWGW